MVWLVASIVLLFASCTDDQRHHRSYVISEAPAESETQKGDSPSKL